MRIMFAARAIDNVAGGVERMVVTIMNSLVARGHHVEFFTWDQAEATSFYSMAPEIIWRRLNHGDPRDKAGVLQKIRRAKAIRQIMARSKPHAVICFQDGPFISLRLYALGLRVPFLAAERNAPTRFDHTSAGRQRNLIYQSFRLARRVIVQCESYRSHYPGFLRNRIVTIPNPVAPAVNRSRPHRPTSTRRYTLLSVGRLSYQKNYDVLIKSFARLARTFPDWDLTIVGDGEDRIKLTALIAEHDLSGRISLVGVRKSLDQSYAGAHCFVLPSRWEGFPNALAEAMAHGLPAVGFADCAGVRDLIVPDHSGLLAEGNGNEVTLAKALSVLLSDPPLRKAMGRAARNRVQPFAIDRIIDQWEQVLSEVISSAASGASLTPESGSSPGVLRNRSAASQ